MNQSPPRALVPIICMLLVAVTLLSLWPVLDAPFSGIDDPEYVTANRQVLEGLTRHGVAWAFTSVAAANYHPLTWISHMLDVTLFGPLPAGHHLTSLLLHTANTLLLFLLLGNATGLVWRSAFVAGLFALHPMHVESVAWIAERKDVLCTFFSLLALLAYVRYARRPGTARYAAVLVSFAAALLSKPMAVTLPFLMLLLDFWPLGRWRQEASGSGQAAVSSVRLLTEKTPLLLLSAISCGLTLYAQAQGGGLVLTLEDMPVHERFGVAAVAYASYLGKLLWPLNLSIHYPLDNLAFPVWNIATASCLPIFISLAAWRLRAGSPWLATGWLWFIGTLVPVIGLVKVGVQFIADRYTYLPAVGLFIAFAWGAARLPAFFPRIQGRWAGVASVVLLLALGWGARLQAGYWRSDESLYRHSIEAVGSGWFVENNLGVELARRGNLEEAVIHYREAIRLNPLDANAQNNLGMTLGQLGRLDEALAHLRKALVIRPDFPDACNSVGNILSMRGEYAEADRYFLEAIRLDPNYWKARVNLAENLLAQGRREESAVLLREALGQDPGNLRAMELLDRSLAGKGVGPAGSD